MNFNQRQRLSPMLFLRELEEWSQARSLSEDSMPTQQIDWTKCPFVEVIPGKVSGRPLLNGTRMPAQDVVDNLDDGMSDEEVAEVYELDLQLVKKLRAYVEKWRENFT